MSKRFSTWVFGAGAALTMLLAACSGGGAPGGYGGTTAATNTPAAPPTSLKTGAVMLNGQSATVLTNSQGLTLYYLSSESATTLHCSASCLTIWPPVLAPNGAPAVPMGAAGTIGVLSGDTTRPQVTYNGHPVYTFSGDHAAGDVNGEGVKGVWFVVDAAAPAAVALSTASVSVKGQMKTVFTNAAGLTLYYLTADTATTPACASGCLSAWPPVLSPFGPATVPASATGTLGILKDATRTQVTYSGWPLYTFSGDSAAGQANGEGIALAGGTWHVATPSLAAASSGYGYTP